jgi:hypothetical protein
MPEVNAVVSSEATRNDAATEPVEEKAEIAEESETSDSDVEKPQKKGGFQRRIEKLGTRISSLEQEATFWRNKALEARPAEVKETPKEASKPKAEDFDTVEKYLDARDAYVEQKAEQKALAAFEARSKEQEAKAEKTQREQTWDDKLKTARDKYSDYNEVMAEATFNISPAMHEAIMTADLGPDVAYYLAQNQEDATRIAKLSPMAAAREIGKIEGYIAELEAEGEEQAEDTEPEKPVTKAPAPLKPIKKSTSSSKDVYDDSLPIEEWRKLREAQLKGKR